MSAAHEGALQPGLAERPPSAACHGAPDNGHGPPLAEPNVPPAAEPHKAPAARSRRTERTSHHARVPHTVRRHRTPLVRRPLRHSPAHRPRPPLPPQYRRLADAAGGRTVVRQGRCRGSGGVATVRESRARRGMRSRATRGGARRAGTASAGHRRQRGGRRPHRMVRQPTRLPGTPLGTRQALDASLTASWRAP